MTTRRLLSRLWSLCCSLKLAIVLASLATLLTMAGSLLIHFNEAVFGDLDQHVLFAWFSGPGRSHPGQGAWLLVLFVLIVLLGLNTLCCFIDWLRALRTRWRKGGEYLLHLGFVLIVVGYCWGAVAGARHSGLTFRPDEPTPLPGLPGLYLRLDRFEPVIGSQGQPVDMRSTVTLLEGDQLLFTRTLHLNHPLLWRDLVILPESYTQEPAGFLFQVNGNSSFPLRAGASLPTADGRILTVLAFYPDARPGPGGQILTRSDRLGDPAFYLQLTTGAGQPTWQGWYFLRHSEPRELAAAGVELRPLQPLFRSIPILTVNRDPGARLALGGACAMLAGVLLALASFYRKRARGDRPQIE